MRFISIIKEFHFVKKTAPIFENCQVEDMTAEEKLFQIASTAAGCSPHEGEAKVLALELECAHLGMAALKEKAEYSRRSGSNMEDVENKALMNLTRAFHRFLKAAEDLEASAKAKSIDFTFGTLLSPTDDEITAAVETTCSEKRDLLKDLSEQIAALMEPCKGWKDELDVNTPIDQVMAAAESTLLAVKGKRLQDRSHSLKKAWSVGGDGDRVQQTFVRLVD